MSRSQSSPSQKRPVPKPSQPDLSTILPRWPISATVISPLQSSGFSGAELWKINTSESQPLCLKHYRSGALTVEQLDGIHRVLIHAFNEGCEFVAKPIPIIILRKFFQKLEQRRPKEEFIVGHVLRVRCGFDVSIFGRFIFILCGDLSLQTSSCRASE